MTRRGWHWRLNNSEIQKRGKALLYDVEYNSERQTLPPCMVFNMTERGKHCHLMRRWSWYREINSSISCCAEYDTERQSLPLCVVLNRTEMQTLMEVCEEMMRGMPRCSDQEWRHKRDWKKEKVGGLLYGFRLLSCGLMAGRWAFAPKPGQIYPRETTDSFCLDKSPTFVCLCWLLSLFFLAHFF